MTTLQTIYFEFQSLQTIQQKIQYLQSNQNYIESNFNINIPNLLKYYQTKI